MTTAVEFISPPMGLAHAPLGLTGKGEIESTPEGIKLRGLMHSGNAASGFGCLGFIVGFVGAIALLVATSITVESLVGKFIVGLGLAVGVGGIFLGRKLFPPKPVELIVPWQKVKSLGFDGAQVSFVSSAKPKGQVWMTVPNPPVSASVDSSAPVNSLQTQRAGGQLVIDELKGRALAAGVTL